MGAYEDKLNEIAQKRQQQEALGSAALQSYGTNPDAYAKQVQLSRKSGLPVDTLPDLTDEAKMRVLSGDFRDLQKTAPATAKYISEDQRAAKLMLDQTEEMGTVERTVRTIAAGFGGAAAGGFHGIGEGLNALEVLVKDKDWYKANQAAGFPKWGEGLKEFSQPAKDYWKSVAPKIDDTELSKYGHGVGQGIGQMATQIPLMLNPVTHPLALAMIYGQSMDSMADKIAADKKAQTADHNLQALEVLGGGAITAATEWFADKFQIKAASSALLPLKNKMLGMASRIASGAGTEFIQEGSENLLQDVAHIIMTNPEAEVGGADAFNAATVGGTVGALTQAVLNAALHIKTRGAQKAFADLSDASKAQKVRERDPQTYQGYADSVVNHLASTTDGAVENIYVDANTFHQLMTDSQLNPQEVVAAMGIDPQTYDEARVAGGDVVIPLNDFVGKVAGTEIGDMLNEHLRAAPDALSIAELEFASKNAPAIAAKAEEFSAKQAERAEWQKSANEVQGQVFEQIKATGTYTPSVARAMSSIVRDFYTTQAAELGVTPAELYQTMPYQVVAGDLNGGGQVMQGNKGLKLFRGDSINPDGLGEGSVGDLGKGHYFTDSSLSAEYFTDGSDKSHTRQFDAYINAPFDLMSRDIASDPRWQAMMATLPPDPEIGQKPRQQLEKWARGETDVRDPYGFVARSFGYDTDTFNDFLAAHGYDSVTDYGVRGVSEGDRQYVIFDKARVSAPLAQNDLADKIAQALTENGPSIDSPVALPPSPTLYQVHPESINEWKTKTTEWMKANGYTDAEIKKHLKAMDGQMKIFTALGAQVEMFPHGAKAAPSKVNSKGIGGPFRGNSDFIYKITFDASAMCVRRLEAGATAAAIEEKINRSLTASERMALVVLFQQAGKVAPCLYCYVESPRTKMSEFAQNAADIVKGDKVIPKRWSEKMQNMAQAAVDEAAGLTFGEDELNVNLIIDPLYQKDNLDAAKALMEKAPATWEFINSAALAAKANLPKLYEEYSGQVLELPQEIIDELNDYAGLRFFSSSDFQAEHVGDLMQAFMDMEMRRIKAHAYTKVVSFAEIFGKTGMKIQLSLFAKVNPDGSYSADTSQGMDWDEAKRLRSEKGHENVGTVFVAASDEQLQWALSQDWIDYIIPFHYSGMASKFYETLGWQDFTSTQSESWIDKEDERNWDVASNQEERGQKTAKGGDVKPKAKKIRMHEIGTVKGISDEQATKQYLKLAMERRLNPVFLSALFNDFAPLVRTGDMKKDKAARAKQNREAKARWKEMVDKGQIDWSAINPNYFKLKKDYARTDTPFNPVQAKFNYDATQKIVDSFLNNQEPKAVSDPAIAEMFIELQKKYGQSMGLEALKAKASGGVFNQSAIPGQKGSGTTQVATTASMYAKAIQAMMTVNPNIKRALDYGAGLGLGADAMRSAAPGVEVETMEPNPERWASSTPPTYTGSDQVKGKYDLVVNTNVLNVLEPDIRDMVLKDIAGRISDDGVALVTTRGWKDDVANAKNFEPAGEDKAIWIIKKTKNGTERVYQKGFDGNELVEYAQRLLGSEYTVKKINGFGKSGVVISKNADSATLFQSGSNKRGGFNPDTLTTILTQQSDYSTFLHETAHFFLTSYAGMATSPNATPKMQEDMQTLLDWFGVKDLAAWNAMTLEQQRPFHEQFAYNYEIYLFEGKAPSVKMQSVFERFSAWLKKIYSSIRDELNTIYRQEHGTDLPILTGEVRDVMDRMLASDDQIKQAEAVRGMAPIFQTQEESGMDDAQWAAYQEMQQEAHDAALAEHTKASLRQMKWLEGAKSRVLKTLQAEAREEREKIRKEVAKDVETWPVYVAEDALKEARKINDYTGVMAVMDALGYTSMEQMEAAVKAATPRKQAIKEMTDQRMLEEHGELTDPKALQAAVEAAIHNEARARFIGVELRHLSKSARPVRVMTEAARQAARSVLGRKAIGTIRPSDYAAAQARAAANAETAMKKGDTAAATQLKEHQLLQNQLASEALKAREYVARQLEGFRKVFASDKILGKRRDMNYVEAARAILAHYGLGQSEKPAADYLAKIKAYDPDFYAEIEPLFNAHMAQAKPVTDLTLDEFTDLADEINALWHLSRRTKQIEIDGELHDRKEVVAELKVVIDRLTDGKAAPGQTKALTEKDERKVSLLGVKSALRRVEHWSDVMDMGDPNGVFRRYVWNPINDAVNNYNAAKLERVKEYKELLKQYEHLFRMADVHSDELNYTFTAKELMHAILHTGNSSNKQKLLLGGRPGSPWADVREDGSVDYTRWETFRQRAMAEGLITKDHYDLAQKIWGMMESFKPAAQKAHREMYGFYFAEVTAEPVETPWGVYAGGYVPAKADPRLVVRAAQNVEQETQMMDTAFAFPTTGRGATMKRVEGYNKPLLLDMSTLASHMDWALRFSFIEPRIKDVARMVGTTNSTFTDAIAKLDPTLQKDMLIPWLQRTAQQQATMPSRGEAGRAFDKFATMMRVNTGLQMMVGNVVNALQQVTGPIIAAVKVPPSNLTSALWRYMHEPTKMAQEIQEKSKFMASRMNDDQFNMTRGIDRILVAPTKMETVKDFAENNGYFLQQGFQNILDTVIWSGAYDAAVAKGASEKDAVRQADSAISMTQEARRVSDLSRSETGTAFVRMFTQYYSYFNNQANLLGGEFANTARKYGVKKGAGRLLFITAMGYSIPAVLSEVISQAFRGFDTGDDDEWGLDDAMKLFFNAHWKYGTAMIPFVGQAANAALNKWNDKPYDDKLSVSPAVSTIEAVLFAPHSVYKALMDDGAWSKATKDALTAIGMITGMPLGQIGKSVGYAEDVAQDRVQPQSGMDVARGFISGRDVNKK